ncbi:MAG: glycosyltransferase, partial [Ignavibacteriales bacterium]|nr:glycosyltransferase [Ignavibacteriales bacterium]
MDLSIIIVNYNVKDFLHHLLQSINAAVRDISAEVIIVDNASTDGSVEMLRREFPGITLIASPENLGFSRANNAGIKKSKGRYILLLNPDTLIGEETFVTMIKFLDEHKEVGLAGCKLLNPDGTLQLACRRGFPGPWVSFCKVTGLSSIFPKSRLFAKYNLTYLDENQSHEVDAISGAFMMIRKEVVDEIGGLDEQFFMYGEDLDWCYRVQKAGHKVYYVHNTKIIHYKGESTKRSNIDETRVFYNAMRLFVRKHFSSYFVVELILRFAISIREVVAFASKWKLIFFSVLLDGFLFNIALYFSARIYETHAHWRGFLPEAKVIVYSVPAIVQVLSGILAGAYNKERLQVLRSVLSIAVSFFVLSSVIYFSKDFAYSRAVLLMTYTGALVLFLGWRIVAKLIFKIGNSFSGASPRKAFIVGTDDVARKIARQLKAKQTQYYSVIGFISKGNDEIGDTVDDLKVVGSLSNIAKMVKEHAADEIIFTVGSLP